MDAFETGFSDFQRGDFARAQHMAELNCGMIA